MAILVLLCVLLSDGSCLIFTFRSVGYPILTFVSKQLSTTTTKNLGVNASGQVRSSLLDDDYRGLEFV